MPRFFETDHVELPGCRTALYDTGPAGGTTLVFVHGIGGAKDVWLPVLKRLPDTWRLVAYDYRGGGETEEEEPGRLSVSQWSDDLALLLEHLAIERPVLVGHSLGASIVLQFALDRPEVASAIVLVGAEAGLCRLGPVMEERGRAILDTGVDGWVKGPWRAAPPFSKHTQATRPEMIDEYSKMLYRIGADRDLRAVRAISESPDFTPRLGEVALPALVLIGGEDDRTTPEVGWALARGLRRGRGVEIPDVGHTLSYEAPERVAGEIADFLAENGLATQVL